MPEYFFVLENKNDSCKELNKYVIKDIVNIIVEYLKIEIQRNNNHIIIDEYTFSIGKPRNLIIKKNASSKIIIEVIDLYENEPKISSFWCFPPYYICIDNISSKSIITIKSFYKNLYQKIDYINVNDDFSYRKLIMEEFYMEPPINNSIIFKKEIKKLFPNGSCYFLPFTSSSNAIIINILNPEELYDICQCLKFHFR
jgi:hypothetical protein